MNKRAQRLLFYWIASFVLATVLYYVLCFVGSESSVFGTFFRMRPYHGKYPLAFIAIPCFFYGIIANMLADLFLRVSLRKQILLTLFIVILTVLVSSPYGGMLWHYYDMKAGFFPQNWFAKLLKEGIRDGLLWGWLVVGLSVPYNIIGAVVCFFLTQKGSTLFGGTPANSAAEGIPARSTCVIRYWQ